MGPEALVGIALERSIEMVVGLLGILKAGAAYLPLDPEYPTARLEQMLTDAAPAVVLTSEAVRFGLPTSTAQVLSFGTLELERAFAEKPADNPVGAVWPEHPAYVIYTSGSTGVPKGVVVGHRQLANYIHWSREAYAAWDGAGAPLNTPLTFDATITSLWLPLVSGQKVMLLPERRQMEALAEVLGSGAELTLAKLTPAHLEALRNLLSEDAGKVRARSFVVGGEALKGHVAGWWQEQASGLRIVNEYGPTETVVGCCVHEVSAGVGTASEIFRSARRSGTRGCMCWTVVWSWCRWGWRESCTSRVQDWREAI